MRDIAPTTSTLERAATTSVSRRTPRVAARVPDRVKKWAILAPTEVLPRPLRVAARSYLLSRLELAKAERAGLIIVGHPKSGNTWLRVQISRLYQVRHGLGASLIAHSDELHRRNSAIPCITSTNGCYSYESAVGAALATHAPDSMLRHKPVVFLARNPCDVAVSWFLQVTKRQSRQKYELINHGLLHPIDRRSVTLWDFVRHSDLGVISLIDYLNDWDRNVRALERAIVVRYEDLRADPGHELRGIATLMGERFTDEEFDDAVAFGSYDNLRELERSGFFRYGGMTLRDPADPETFKVRRAKVGGYRDYLSAEQSAELEELMAARLSPSFGYTSCATASAPRA